MTGALQGAWWAWPAAAALYLAFRLWYDNLRGPLMPAEVDAFMAQAAEREPTGGHTDLAVLRAFLQADDGREFVMSNLLRLHTQPVPHPVTGAPTPSPELLNHYVRRFIPLLLRHGGHPVMAMRKVGGYVDAWQTPADPGWHVVGSMRYRSRRDMMRLAFDPALRDAHPYKVAATAETFSFPTQVVAGVALRPRVTVALGLSLVAALVHLASLLR